MFKTNINRKKVKNKITNKILIEKLINN